MNDGIFTPRWGPEGETDAPPVDGDGTELRETLAVVYPSPGHMRVARQIRHPKSGNVEFQEEYREPTPEERNFLKAQGVPEIGPGSMIPPGAPSGMPSVGDVAPAAAAAPAAGFPWGKVGLALAVGVAGTVAAMKWVVPKLTGASDEGEDGDGDEGDDGDD